MFGPVTIIIPVYNQAFALNLTLHALEEQHFPERGFAVIVVDDGSSEPIAPVVEAHTSRLDIRCIRLNRSGRAAARNRGLAEAGDGLAIFCDADRLPRPDFVQAHVRAHAEADDLLVIGQVREMYVPDPERHRNRIADNLRLARHDRTPQYFRLVSRMFAADGAVPSPVPWVAAFSGNMSARVALCREVGGFDENFREWGFEHFEFGFRAFHSGTVFRYASDAVNVHIAHSRSASYKALIAASHSYFYRKHPRPGVRRFLDFMLGEASLGDLARAAEKDSRTGLSPERAGEIDSVWDDLYVKITNM